LILQIDYSTALVTSFTFLGVYGRPRKRGKPRHKVWDA
jgi:hypothetical protein